MACTAEPPPLLAQQIEHKVEEQSQAPAAKSDDFTILAHGHTPQRQKEHRQQEQAEEKQHGHQQNEAALAAWEARRAQGVRRLRHLAAIITFYAAVTAFVTLTWPTPTGFFRPPAGASGLTLAEVGAIAARAGAMLVAMTLAQDAARPLLGRARRGEKVFFGCSILVRGVLLAGLWYHHYGE